METGDAKDKGAKGREDPPTAQGSERTPFAFLV